jgi:uncharacterized membrane protein
VLDTLRVLTVLVVGLMVGVELAVAAVANPIFNRLDVQSALAARGDGARLLGRVMPFWYVGSLLLGALWATLTWGSTQAAPVVAGTALLAVSVVLSVTLLVPINSRAARWAAGEAPADWRRQLTRWDRLHLLRVVIIIAGFALFTVAAVH